MRLSFVLCASVAACGFVPLAGAATNPPLSFTLDLLGPCTQSGCTGTHPTDIGLNLAASSFSYAPGTGSASGAFIATMDVNTPVVCDEIASGGILGARTGLRLAPTFANSAPGGLLEFNAGGPSIVDLNAMLYDGTLPGVAASYSNYGTTLPPQVVCYRINPISGGPIAIAAGPYGIFASGFDSSHLASEPWLSVQTVFSPHTGGSKPGSPQINGITLPNAMGYVVQVHNAVNAVGWHLDLGYDFAFFDTTANGGMSPVWCILDAGIPQPGPLDGSPASCGTVSSTHTLSLADIQSGSGSIYIYVENDGSSTATGAWNFLTNTIYPAVASIFPPFGTYPQRFDDKVAVASANNLPTLNIGSIVCNNDVVSTSCQIADQDGHAVPAAVTFGNAITGGGAVTMDPLAYFVDPAAGTTLPGNTAALTVTNVSCSDPNGILTSSLGTGNFTSSTGHLGAKALGFAFKPSGSPNFPYVAGTATCTATFSTTGFLPALSSTQSFTITMQQSLVGSVTLSAPPGPAAPNGNLTYTLVVANAGTSALTNVVATDNQADATFTVNSWSCTGTGATCPHATGTGNLNETIPTMPAGGSLAYAVTGIVGAIASNPVAQITNTGSISVPGGSCAGGLCIGTASVATVPIIGVAKAASESSYHTNDAVTYTITLSNQGGTPATGLALADAVPSGVAFVSWACVAVGANSSCPNLAGGTGDISESAISIDTGGSVTYAVLSTVTSTGGTVTNTAAASGLNGGAVCAGPCSASAAMTPGT